MSTPAELLKTLDELEQLEKAFAATPNTDLAIKMAATRQVAIALGQKVDVERAENEERKRHEKRAQLERQYQETNRQVDELYAKAEAGLTAAIEATDSAHGLHNESRRLASMIIKLGGEVPVLERSFWSRYPALRNRFIGSVLRNGEP